LACSIANSLRYHVDVGVVDLIKAGIIEKKHFSLSGDTRIVSHFLRALQILLPGMSMCGCRLFRGGLIAVAGAAQILLPQRELSHSKWFDKLRQFCRAGKDTRAPNGGSGDAIQEIAFRALLPKSDVDGGWGASMGGSVSGWVCGVGVGGGACVHACMCVHARIPKKRSSEAEEEVVVVGGEGCSGSAQSGSCGIDYLAQP
jgi:hypothetical protein